MKLNLQQFAGSLTLTVLNDGHFSATTASPSSSLAENDMSTLTITPSSGYELDEIEVIAGGGSVEYDAENEAWKVKMGASNGTVFVKGKKNNLYKVVEETPVWINGTSTLLKRNMKVIAGKNGAVVDVECTPTEVTISADVIAELVKAGALIKV